MFFWEKDIETIDQRSLELLQIDRINTALYRIAHHKPYRDFYAQHHYNIKPLKKLEDIRKLPFLDKPQLQQAYPMQFAVIDKREIVRIHSTDGNTEFPTVIFYSKTDIETWSSLVARCLCMIGLHNGDVLQNSMSYGISSSGLGVHYGAELLDMLVIPTGIDDTDQQLKFMEDLQTTAIYTTPGYALHLASLINQNKKRDKLALRIALIAGEPYSEATRAEIQDTLQIKAFNLYGLSAMNGPGVACECLAQDGLHVWEDNFFMEIIDPSTGAVLPDGEEGELVLSAFNREAMPLFRYRTGNRTFIYPDKCPCGRTHRRIAPVKGCTDDLE